MVGNLNLYLRFQLSTLITLFCVSPFVVVLCAFQTLCVCYYAAVITLSTAFDMGCCQSKEPLAEANSEKTLLSTSGSSEIPSDSTSAENDPVPVLVEVLVSVSTSNQKNFENSQQKTFNIQKIAACSASVDAESESPMPEVVNALTNTSASKLHYTASSNLNIDSDKGLTYKEENLTKACSKNKKITKPQRHTESADRMSNSVILSSEIPECKTLAVEEDFDNLEPICEISNKDIISIEQDICGNTKENLLINKLIYVLIAHKICAFLEMPLEVVELCGVLNEMTEQMKRVVNSLPGDTLSKKAETFVRSFDRVFEVKGHYVARLSSGQSWLQAVLTESLKGVIIEIIHEGKKYLSDLVEFLVRALGCSSIPDFGEITDTSMAMFLAKYKTVFGTAGQTVFLVPSDKKLSGPNIDQVSLPEIASFFKEELKAYAIPYTELSVMLSMKKPQLLANLVDRTSNGILGLLLKDTLFKCDKGLVMLKGFTPVSSENLIPDKPFSEITDTNMKCCCSSGIVMCSDKSRATLWCTYSEVCKNVLVVARRSETVVDMVLGNKFQDVLMEGAKVIFTTINESKNGWSVDYAVQIKTVPGNYATCLCRKSKCMDVFYQQVAQANGVPHSQNFLFFWNCRGVLQTINGSKGTVKCRFSSFSDQYFFAYFTDKSWFVGLDPSEIEQNLSAGDTLDVDLALRNQTGRLMWFACSVRKVKFSTSKTKVAFNCLGTISEVSSSSILITIQEGGKDGPRNGERVFCSNSSVLLFDDGSVSTIFSPDIFSVNNPVVIDAEKKTTGSWVAKFIRQNYRPNGVHSLLPAINNSVAEVSALCEVMTQDFPSFQNISVENINNLLTLAELGEILDKNKLFTKDLVTESLSWSSDPYNLVKGIKNLSVRNTSCQTVSTGPVLSTKLPI